MIDLKKCCKCKIEKGKNKTNFRFRNEKGREDEFRCVCRDCEKKDWKLWYLKNKQYRKEYKNQEWYREYSRLYAKKYMLSHKKERSFLQRQRVIRKLLNGGKFSFKEWGELKREYNYTCLSCGKKEPEIKLTMDHIKPLKWGGKNEKSNIQPLCKYCNSIKHLSTIDYRGNQ